MIRELVLGSHVIAGTAALASGPLALRRLLERRPGLVGQAYYASCAATCASAAGLSILRWSTMGWLLPVSAVSFALLECGRRAWSRRSSPLVAGHGLGGSYIALVTALVVVSARDISPWLELAGWVLPTAIGAPLAHRLTRRFAREWSRRDHS